MNSVFNTPNWHQEQPQRSVGQTITNDTKDFFLSSPQDPGGSYFLLASFSNAIGVPTWHSTMRVSGKLRASSASSPS